MIYRDAVDGGHWPDQTTQASIRQRVLDSAIEGAIVVFHTDRPDTAASLAAILKELRGAGAELGPLSSRGSVPSSRIELHPDFEGLEIRTGYIRPKAAGNWRSFNLHETGAATRRQPNLLTNVALVGNASVDLITGDPSGAFEAHRQTPTVTSWCCTGTCGAGFEAQQVRTSLCTCTTGDLVLWPSGAGARLECTRRWTGLLMSTQLA